MIVFYIWFIVVMVILILCPKDRIKLMADFFAKVLPRIPITGIIRELKNNEKQKA